MSFGLFLVYILFTYLRPFETIAPGMAPYRPMLILWLVAFLAAAIRAMTLQEVAARSVHFGLLGVLICAISMSQAVNGYLGGALPAVLDFSAAAMLMVLCLLNLTTPRRLRVTCGVILLSVTAIAGLGTYSFHTGFMADELVVRQTAPEFDDGVEANDERQSLVPADDKSGRYLLRLRGVGFLNDPKRLRPNARHGTALVVVGSPSRATSAQPVRRT